MSSPARTTSIACGEYVGQRERVEVRYWRTRLAPAGDWAIANDGTNKKYPGVWVSFGYETDSDKQPEAILVDFTWGSTGYEREVSRTEESRRTKRITDSSAGEVLILNPDGKLILREGASDAADETRRQRLAEVRRRISNVKNPSNKSPFK
jgi:hypothetical protein